MPSMAIAIAHNNRQKAMYGRIKKKNKDKNKNKDKKKKAFIFFRRNIN